MLRRAPHRDDEGDPEQHPPHGERDPWDAVACRAGRDVSHHGACGLLRAGTVTLIARSAAAEIARSQNRVPTPARLDRTPKHDGIELLLGLAVLQANQRAFVTFCRRYKMSERHRTRCVVQHLRIANPDDPDPGVLHRSYPRSSRTLARNKPYWGAGRHIFGSNYL